MKLIGEYIILTICYILISAIVLDACKPYTFLKVNKAVVIMNGQINGKIISGFIEITEISSEVVSFIGTINGLEPNSIHGFHVHQFGDTRESCMKSGAHYNPFNKIHGGPQDTDRHVGDLGNVVANSQGDIKINITDKLVRLSGKYSVVGRAIVLHEKIDIYSVQPSGDSGSRIACGVIGIIDETSAS